MSQHSTRQHIEERRRAQRRRSRIILIGAVIGVALLVAGFLILLNRPVSSVPITGTDYEGLTQEVDNSGVGVGFAIGDPNAPLTLVVYSDFSCPHCHDLAKVIEQLIEDYVRLGTLRIVYKPISFVYPPASRPAAQAAICAGQQGKFWEMHNYIWALYESSGVGAYTQRQLAAGAESIGLDMQAFNSCFISAQTSILVDSVLEEASQRGINGTPKMYLNGVEVIYRGAELAYDDLRRAIEAQLGGS